MRALLALLVFVTSVQAVAQVHVRGYVRKDGTYVAPHMRSNPNKSRADNWSSQGNINPYTGAVGTVNPYAAVPRVPSYLSPLPSLPQVPIYASPSKQQPTPRPPLCYTIFDCVE